ncbi:hypothetical protein PVK06_041402 [Gossypium arboreum]|uniref:Uncharacterized protein n=1 Tax=Gossypium arboreum TaxID=29729 RepID=A0ABR0N860_GOSAR|nr:hypothetical protein PVK06_041402 [Gossypium arboreum]
MTVGDTLIRGKEVCGLKKLEILLGLSSNSHWVPFANALDAVIPYPDIPLWFPSSFSQTDKHSLTQNSTS